MKKVMSLVAVAGMFVFASCEKNTKVEETNTTTTTTTEPVETTIEPIEVDPDNAVLKTDTTLEHPYPTSTPAGTTNGK